MNTDSTYESSFSSSLNGLDLQLHYYNTLGLQMRRRRNRSSSRRSLPPSHTFVTHMNTMNGGIVLNPQYDSSMPRNSGFIMTNGTIPVTSINPGLCVPPAAQIGSNQEQSVLVNGGGGHEELVAYSVQTNPGGVVLNRNLMNQDQSMTLNGSGQSMAMTNGQNMSCPPIINSEMQLAYLQAYNYSIEENCDSFNNPMYLLPMMPEILQLNGHLLQQNGNSSSQQNLVSSTDCFKQMQFNCDTYSVVFFLLLLLLIICYHYQHHGD